MGCSSSSEGEEVTIPPAYDPKDIYYDRYGNLRYGHVVNDREDELRRVVVNDIATSESHLCYIVDSSWMNAWLMFTHYDRYVSPNPGPCRNDDLVMYDPDKKQWVGKPSLIMAMKDSPGHYCRVSPDAWNVFIECYPGCGPTIKAYYQKGDPHFKDGKFDTSEWIIDSSECKSIHTHHSDSKADVGADGKSRQNSFRLDNGEHMMEEDTGNGIHLEVLAAQVPEENLSAHHMTDASITLEKVASINAFFGTALAKAEKSDVENLAKKYSSKAGQTRVLGTHKPEKKIDGSTITPSAWLFGDNPQVP
mmetsp:Transcript_19981/g.28704  ORF Transcript_19981/g.28704 Transcript_19981/m.28704 type:complete len:306 (-) Transcript_19981:233-1150(-)|eukprot:CAMPEP_0185027948 /NCGR_PEP_ID=MMETSP1103-20130426/13311_1 /TAXON_ID=36769 /ORGANISM="Paraphysomonas bandaiensis, Strain Caron Lab Isolate" /LENGTH=305 /DNA_ID=CAMNT_0027562155 /DNA_START=51 /DNA_END=968 /DNA_ORIENTATION=+